MDLIQTYFNGKSVCLSGMHHDGQTLIFKLCRPEPFEKIGVIVFSGVTEYKEVRHEEKDADLLEVIFDFMLDKQLAFLELDSCEIEFRFDQFQFHQQA